MLLVLLCELFGCLIFYSVLLHTSHVFYYIMFCVLFFLVGSILFVATLFCWISSMLFDPSLLYSMMFYDVLCSFSSVLCYDGLCSM